MEGLDFGEEMLKYKEYETVFGPVFCHAGRKFKLDDVGLRGAVTRLTCAREPDRIGFHEALRDNQFRNFGAAKIFDRFMCDKASWLLGHRSDLLSEEAREVWVHAPHPKRKLRERTHAELALSGALLSRVWLGNHGYVKYVCKPGEKLPPGKYLRATADLGSIGAAQGGYMMDLVKESFAQNFVVDGCSYQFVKSPEQEVMASAFQDVWEDRYDIALRCFSDDAIIGINTPEGRYVANTDISACDGSNYDPVFLLLRDIMRAGGLDRRDVDGTFEQCLAECVITSYADAECKRKRRKVVLKPKYYTLYSGSVLTTSINNCANFGIFASVCDVMPPYAERRLSDMPGIIAAAAERVGYILKCQTCTILEDLQFLKISPTLVDGEYKVFLNLGVMLRVLGSCRGDLPGKGDLHQRARIYISDVVKSFKHAGDHVITETLRRWIVSESLGVVEERLLGESKFVIPVEALSRRYKLSVSDVQNLADSIACAQFGDAVNSPAIDRIFELDYGYPSLLSIDVNPSPSIIH